MPFGYLLIVGQRDSALTSSVSKQSDAARQGALPVESRDQVHASLPQGVFILIRHGAAVGQCVFSSNSLFGLMCVFGSSVRMQVCFLLLLIQLHVTEGCRLEGNREIKPITAYTGGSVLLPCSCTDLHTKPDTFTWRKITNETKWVEIPPESEQYKDRFQLVNDHSSGNFSLLISHLTEEDGGDYKCRLKESEYRDFKLTVVGCTRNRQTVTVTGYVGQSVLLPCSCSELQAKPHTFRWIFFKGSDRIKLFPKDQTNPYTDRVQLFNDHHPGNLSLLISHLTVEDGGWYRCKISNTIDVNVILIVKDAPTRPSTSTAVITTTSPNSKPGVTTKATKPTPVVKDKTTAHSETSSEKDAPTRPSTSTAVITTTSPNSKPGVTTKPTPVVKDKTTAHSETSSEKDAPTRPSTSTAVITTTSPNSKPGVTTKATKPTPVVKDKTTAHSETSSEKDAPTRPSTSTAVITTTSPNSKPGVTTKATKPTPVVKDKTTAHSETSSEKDAPTRPSTSTAVITTTSPNSKPGTTHH
ncbi:cell adhesion molecule DSCAM-like [Pangasianodon hypophthalmus]|uniref:cell adhesion molecule DSCAM-like n=1 Tax=Pangasianodon hypophthalmus TaxID=310915 RepID=UPI0023077A1C|nr:cell adhesion molecule DSCAM-like [Pangasianodon hypophthalmus]